METWKEGSELLQFLQNHKLENFVPNIAAVLRIYLTIAMGVAS